MRRTCALLVVAFAVLGGFAGLAPDYGVPGGGARSPMSRKVGRIRSGTPNLCEAFGKVRRPSPSRASVLSIRGKDQFAVICS